MLDPPPLDAAALAAIAARADAATYGPWEHRAYSRTWTPLGLERFHDNPPIADHVADTHEVVTSWIHGQAHDKVRIFCVMVSPYFDPNYDLHVRPEDAEFVAHARADVPALLATLAHAHALLDAWLQHDPRDDRAVMRAACAYCGGQAPDWEPLDADEPPICHTADCPYEQARRSRAGG